MIDKCNFIWKDNFMFVLKGFVQIYFMVNK